MELAEENWNPEVKVLGGAFGRAYRRYRIDGRPRMDDFLRYLSRFPSYISTVTHSGSCVRRFIARFYKYRSLNGLNPILTWGGGGGGQTDHPSGLLLNIPKTVQLILTKLSAK